MYKYGFSGLGASGDRSDAGYVVPYLFNKKLSDVDVDSSSYNQLSVKFNHGIWVETLSGDNYTYCLKQIQNTAIPDAGSFIYEYNQVDANGNTLQLQFIGQKLYVKITASNGLDGKAFISNREYDIDILGAEVFNPDTCVTVVHRDGDVDLSRYNRMTETSD